MSPRVRPALEREALLDAVNHLHREGHPAAAQELAEWTAECFSGTLADFRASTAPAPRKRAEHAGYQLRGGGVWDMRGCFVMARECLRHLAALDARADADGMIPADDVERDVVRKHSPREIEGWRMYNSVATPGMVEEGLGARAYAELGREVEEDNSAACEAASGDIASRLADVTAERDELRKRVEAGANGMDRLQSRIDFLQHQLELRETRLRAVEAQLAAATGPVSRETLLRVADAIGEEACNDSLLRLLVQQREELFARAAIRALGRTVEG